MITRPVSFSFTIVISMALTAMVNAADDVTLPEPSSAEYCQLVQQLMADTSLVSDNTLFTDMPAYRHSKPMVDPLQTFQVVSYQGTLPIMVSCKIKGAAHVRAAYGEAAAGEQTYCPSITQLAQQQAVDELKAAGNEAAAAIASALVIDNTEPGMTGQSYLADFELSYVDEDKAVHLSSPGLFHDYDSWITWILPETLEGQVYCHLPTVAYMKGLATGELSPGTLMTTAADAPVQPY